MANLRDERLIGSRQAAGLLGISLRTLYSYVSRGKIGRTVDTVSGDSLFNHAEVLEYVRRRDRGRNPTTAARATLNFGLPVLDSHICAIKAGRPWFRGLDAIAYSESATLEDAAALLWGIDTLPSAAPPLSVFPLGTQTPFLSRFGQWLLSRHQCTPHNHAPTQVERIADASHILRGAVSIATGVENRGGEIHHALCDAWRLPAGSADVVRRTLVLHADHELNPSSFVARCTASTQASLYAATLSACCAATGARHADFSQAYELIDAVLRGMEASAIMAPYDDAEDGPPGFNHPLYPKGDPRASAILRALRVAAPRAGMDRIDRFLEAAQSRHGWLPKNDFAVAAMAHLLGLPREACATLFVIARVTGWTAHALEQYGSAFVIRPRAQYVPD